MIVLLQYQRLAEPLEPSLTTPQNLDWLREQTPLPNYAPSRRHVHLHEVAPLEPSLIVSQNLAWLREPNCPRNPIPPRFYQNLAEPLEPSLITAQNLGWLREQNQPLNRVPPRQYQTHAAPTFNLADQTVTPLLWWTDPPRQPVAQPRHRHTSDLIIEPILNPPEPEPEVEVMDWYEPTSFPWPAPTKRPPSFTVAPPFILQLVAMLARPIEQPVPGRTLQQRWRWVPSYTAPPNEIRVPPRIGLIPRVPDPRDVNRLARFTEKVMALLNSLISKGYIVQVGEVEWELVPNGSGGIGSGLTGTFSDGEFGDI